MESKGTKPYTKDATICWDCENAVPCEEKGHGCPWSKNFEPVEGWKAVRTKISQYGLYNKNYKNSRKYEVVSYIVKKCPLFAEG